MAIFAKKKQILEELKITKGLLNQVSKNFPISWPQYYLDLASKSADFNPIARMGRPTEIELQSFSEDIEDPISDHEKRLNPFLIQKYPDRVLILATKRCHFYCRFCFRRDEGVKGFREPDTRAWQDIFGIIRNDESVKEVILSGGDPFTLSDSKIKWIMKHLGAIPSLEKIRIHTRTPVHFPQRITPALMEACRSHFPLTIVTHFNHFLEFTPPSQKAINRILENGYSIKNQSVLLAGVNDCPWVLMNTHNLLLKWGIEPYYLHHPDRVKGNHLFRVSLARGLSIYRSFSFLTGTKRPNYVLDLPDGRGKISVVDMELKKKNQFEIKIGMGRTSQYADIPCSIPWKNWDV